MTNGIQPPSLLCNVNGAEWRGKVKRTRSFFIVAILCEAPVCPASETIAVETAQICGAQKDRRDRGSVKEVAGEQHLGSNNVTANKKSFKNRKSKTLSDSRFRKHSNMDSAERRKSEILRVLNQEWWKVILSWLLHTKTKAERMQISSKPQYKEVRFSSTSPNVYDLLKSFNSLTFLSWRRQHECNANPTLRQHEQPIYTAMGLRSLLAAWHRWGVAQAEPAATRMNLKQTCFPNQDSSHHPHIRCHMRQILSPCPWFSTIFLMLYTGMHQSRLKTVSLLHGWPSTQQGSQLRRSPQCCQWRHPERSHQVISGRKMKE